MNRGIRSRRALVLLLPLAVSACVSGPSPVDHHYRLEVPPPATPLAKPVLAGVVEVDRPSAEALTDQLPMLYRDADDVEIQRHTYHLWISPPTTMVQNQLIDYLRAAGVARQVVSPQARVRTDYHVTGRIDRLERVLGSGGSKVVVDLDLSLTSGGGRLVLLKSYRVEKAAAGADVSHAVRAYDEALAAIFQRFVDDLGAAGS